MSNNRSRVFLFLSLLILTACDGDPLFVGKPAHSALDSYTPPLSGLVGSYSGDVDGSDSARGHNGTLIGGATISAGQVAGGFQFNGQAAGVQVPNHNDFNFGTGNFTIETLVRVDFSVVGREYLGLIGKLDASGRGYAFFLGPSGQIGLQLANSSSDFDNHFSPAPTARDGRWHRVAVTVDRSSGVRFFVDGVATETAPQHFRISTDVTNAGDLYLGRHWSNLQFSLAGGLDEVSIFDRVPAAGPNATPVIDEAFQSSDSVAPSGTVSLSIIAHDPEGGALTFVWSANGGTIGMAVSNATQSQVAWTAPPEIGGMFIVSVVIRDTDGQETTRSFSVAIVLGSVQLPFEIRIVPAQQSLARGASLQFRATGFYADSTTQDLTAEVAWASGAPSIATVSNAAGSHGLVSGVNEGTATITATLGNVSSSVTIIVTPPQLISIGVTPIDSSIVHGATQQFIALGTYTDNTTLDVTFQATWSGDISIVSISNDPGSRGLATGVGVGTTSITAALGDVRGTTTLTVTPPPRQLLSIAVTPAEAYIPRCRTQQLTAIGTYTDGTIRDITTEVTWRSSDIGVGLVSNHLGSRGLAFALEFGIVSLIATADGISGFSTLIVIPPREWPELTAISITPINASVTVGTRLQFKAVGAYIDDATDLTAFVMWDSSDASIALFSYDPERIAGSDGLASTLRPGSVTINATLCGASDSTIFSVLE